MRFDGTSFQAATRAPAVARHAASAPERPLVVEGEPGAGRRGEATRAGIAAGHFTEPKRGPGALVGVFARNDRVGHRRGRVTSAARARR